jgi:hypothetical protein
VSEDVILDLRDRLARIEVKLDSLIVSGTDHESRLRQLEGRQSRIVGGASVLGAMAGFVAGFVTRFIG